MQFGIIEWELLETYIPQRREAKTDDVETPHPAKSIPKAAPLFKEEYATGQCKIVAAIMASGHFERDMFSEALRAHRKKSIYAKFAIRTISKSNTWQQFYNF